MITRRTSVLAIAAGLAGAGLFTTGALAGAAGPNTVPTHSKGGPVASVATGDRFAVVNADGSVARGKGVSFAANIAPGQYEVHFNRNVSRCSYLATIGSSASSGIETTGEVTTVRRVGTSNGVFLTTADSAGTFANRGFHLLVACP